MSMQSGQFTARPKRTSQYVGVLWEKNRWRARRCVAGKSRHAGYFHNEEEAARAADAMVRKFAPENHKMRMNFPNGDELLFTPKKERKAVHDMYERDEAKKAAEKARLRRFVQQQTLKQELPLFETHDAFKYMYKREDDVFEARFPAQPPRKRKRSFEEDTEGTEDVPRLPKLPRTMEDYLRKELASKDEEIRVLKETITQKSFAALEKESIIREENRRLKSELSTNLRGLDDARSQLNEQRNEISVLKIETLYLRSELSRVDQISKLERNNLHSHLCRLEKAVKAIQHATPPELEHDSDLEDNLSTGAALRGNST